MRVKDKMVLIDFVKSRLYKEFNSKNIGIFLGEFNLSRSYASPTSDIKAYIDQKLAGISNSELMRIIEELDMSSEAILTAHKVLEQVKSQRSSQGLIGSLGKSLTSKSGQTSSAGVLSTGLASIGSSPMGSPPIGLASRGSAYTGLAEPAPQSLTRPASPSLTQPTYDASPARAFISHLATHKSLAKVISTSLLHYNIKGFVAHDDIDPTEEWQEEIKKELNAMDFLISLHTEGFSKSIWCQQEIGFAVAKDVLVIPIRLGEDPMGFISKYQALTTENGSDGYIEKILDILQKHKKTKALFSAKIAPKVSH